MKFYDSSSGLQPGLVVWISGCRSDDVIGLLRCSLAVVDLRARQEAQLTHDYLSRKRSLDSAMVRPTEKLRYSLGSWVVTNRKNRTMSLCVGTD